MFSLLLLLFGWDLRLEGAEGFQATFDTRGLGSGRPELNHCCVVFACNDINFIHSILILMFSAHLVDAV